MTVNGIDILLTLAGFAIIAGMWRQMGCERRARELNERHEENKRHWRVVERCEAYSMRHTVDSFIDEVLEDAA